MGTDLVGSTVIPLVAPATGEACTDPVLTYLLSFFQAVGNAYSVAAWQAVQPGAGALPIKTIHAYNPETEGIVESELPALFLWRAEQSNSEEIADDLELFTGRLMLQWVPPTMVVAQRRARDTFARGLFLVLNTYFERGRDPAWYVPGDKYPERTDLTDAQNAANTRALGSVLGHYATFWRCRLKSWVRKELTIRMLDGASKTYPSFLATCPIEEDATRDITRFDELEGGVDITIPKNSDDDNADEDLVEGVAD